MQQQVSKQSAKSTLFRYHK